MELPLACLLLDIEKEKVVEEDREAEVDVDVKVDELAAVTIVIITM